jgi:putative transposase
VSCYRFIAVEKAQYSVAQLCRVLQVAPSGFYAWRHRQPSQRALANVTLTEQIQTIHEWSRRTYGAPRIHAELQARKKRVSRKRVARLMRVAGLVGRPPRRFRRTTVADPTVQVEDLVQRSFTAAAPDQKWFGDITYIRTWEGWLYLAVILNAYSRKVVGWAMADHLRTELATAALEMALRTRRPNPGLLHHTDRGVQPANPLCSSCVTKVWASRRATYPTSSTDSVAPRTWSGASREPVWGSPVHVS